MNDHSMHYIGLDIHKKVIAFCVKLGDGTVVSEGTVTANRLHLNELLISLPSKWSMAVESTMFTPWVYDFFAPHGEVIPAHPLLLRAITEAKKKSDKIDAATLADLLRCDLLPRSYMMPKQYRELRTHLRYRYKIVQIRTIFKNKMSSLLMEHGVEYNADKLHTKRYFEEFMEHVEYVPESIVDLLTISRTYVDLIDKLEYSIIASLQKDSLLRERVRMLRTIDGVGPITALTWVLEIGDPHRFRAVKDAVSFCGLCAAHRESAGVVKRGPLSKKRNKHIQRCLVEAAKLAPRYNPDLAELYEKELARGNRNRATLAVARKLVKYLLAVDKRGTAFVERNSLKAAA